VRRTRKWSPSGEMNTWVLCLSRLKAFEWTIRSRSRWNSVRSGWGSSAVSRPFDSPDRTAFRPRICRSISSVRSRTLWPGFRTGVRVAPAHDSPAEAARSAAKDPVVEVGERLSDVALEARPLALRRGPEVGRHVAADAKVGRHPSDPQVVPWVRHQEGGRHLAGPHE